MGTTSVSNEEITRHEVDRRGVARHGSPRARGIAEDLSAAIVLLMVVASAAGLLFDDLYPDGPWAREALRGGDLTTLILAAPILMVSLVLVRRGSRRALAAWLGALAYSVYNYAYYAFGAEFNDVFLLHVALLALSIWAATLAVAGIDVDAVAAALNHGRASRWVGGFLAFVGTILGVLWIALSVRFAISGELMADIPRRGIHLVFAIDLSLLVPALVVAGVLCWRGTALGVVFAGVMTVMGGLYQANLLVAGLFQADTDVPGAKAFPPEGVVLAIGFILAATLMFWRRGGVRG
jgi:hypothetical protein